MVYSIRLILQLRDWPYPPWLDIRLIKDNCSICILPTRVKCSICLASGNKKKKKKSGSTLGEKCIRDIFSEINFDDGLN